MKRTIFLSAIVIAIIVFIYSCNNDTTVTGPGGGTGNCVTSISGQIVNWTHRGKVYLYLKVYDSTLTNMLIVDTGVINSNGTFSINLTTPPSGGLLNPPVDSTCHPTISYPAGVKLAPAYLYVYDSMHIQIGTLLRTNHDSSGIVAGEFIVSFIYSNVAFSLSGTSVCADHGDTVSVSLSGQACWNKTVIQYVNVFGGLPTKISESNTEPDNSANWYYNGSPQPEQSGINRRNY